MLTVRHRERQMEYYRELNLDDPFRRNERENPSPGDDGDLFGLRPRARQLRVLIDSDSPTPNIDQVTYNVFGRLLQYRFVQHWQIHLSQVNEPDNGEAEPGMVYLHKNASPDMAGPYGFPGPFYGLRVFTDAQNNSGTSISPGIQLAQNLKDFQDRGGEDALGLSSEDIERNVLLTQTAQQINADIVVSTATTVGRNDVPSNHDANVFTPEQAIPIIAHHLRTQQIYVLNPLRRLTSTRKMFYQEGVCALAPRIWHWLGACQRASDLRSLAQCRGMIGRLLRALKAFDHLRFHIGSYPGVETYDDVGDCVDRIMLSLCGAVDVMARSLHFALQLPGSERNAKLHSTSWYNDNVRPVYANAPGITQLDAAQGSIALVFKLRNTIHSSALQATTATSEPARYVQLERGRTSLIVPSDIYDDLSADERTDWGLTVVGQSPGGDNVIAADLATVTATALNRVFRFLDRLCWVISFEVITDKADVLKENIISGLSIVGPENTAMLGLQSAAADDTTNAPYPLP